MTDNNQKVAVVTGASSGIGLVVARELARQGWRVIGLGRNPDRAERAMASIRADVPGANIEMVLGDLSVMAEAVRLARDVAGLTTHIDLLVNNAGGTPANRQTTADGFEHTFAANHLGPFLFTRELLPLLRKAAPGSQIINVSSVAHRFVKDMIWDDLQLERNFDAGKAYSQSKLANILFTRALAVRLGDEGIKVNAVHPGLVQSNFDSHGNRVVKLLYWFSRPFSLTPEQGADTILWLATHPDPGTGGYFAKRKQASMTPAAESDEGAERLWTISEQLLAEVGV
ncbi:MAG: short-chain dehydrogenase [Porticoccaceae bacterium]|nr:short-chain dehydrogenase [Porticoccaceae bacterium]